MKCNATPRGWEKHFFATTWNQAQVKPGEVNMPKKKGAGVFDKMLIAMGFKKQEVRDFLDIIVII